MPFASRWQHVAAELVRALCKMPTRDTNFSEEQVGLFKLTFLYVLSQQNAVVMSFYKSFRG